MRNLYASADAIFRAFDDRIVGFLDKNRKAIEKEYRSVAGRPVSDSEISSFLSGLGDAIYDRIDVDPAQLDRFVGFYVNDSRLQQMVSDAIESSVVGRPVAASRLSGLLRSIASDLDRSPAPSLSGLRGDLSRLISSLNGRE